jgi:hypothetical protein
VHYDGEAARGDAYRQMVADGMRPGYAAEDGVALHFEGRELLRAVSSRPTARAYHVTADGERPISVQYLGEPERVLAVA